MPVSLNKTPQLLFFLAVVAYPGTEKSKVYRVTLARDEDYDALLEELHGLAAVVEAGELCIVIAGDRSAAYAAAHQGSTSEAMLDKWLGQQGV
ncbi:hypothetical protein ACFY1J_05505 [Streptomyces sp. NPDC001406]|uniref:hypothetical protein n=1 Tax=Streptomyces sp. NPDC001406 TaxID=3364572 RepID=UPI003675086D